MCSEHRATFQKTTMEENGATHTSFCLTLTRIQAWVAVIVGAFAIIGGVFGAVRYINHSVEATAERVFDAQLESYHAVMRPQLYQRVDQAIDQKVLEHKIAVEKPFDERLEKIEGRITALETTISIVVPDLKKSVDRNSDKLDRIIERLD